MRDTARPTSSCAGAPTGPIVRAVRHFAFLSAALALACAPDRSPGVTTDGSTGLSCEPGTDGCVCLVDGDGCLGDLVCSGNVCVDPTRTTSDPGSSGSESSSTGDETSGSSTDPAASSSSSASASTGDASSCGDGVVESNRGEDCDIGGVETKLCDDDCTWVQCGDLNVNEAAGETCDDGNVDNTDGCLDTCVAASCGDGFVQAGVEECDDGNDVDGDGCDAACARERWAHVGVAHDVPVADLHKWEPEPCWSSTYEAGPEVASVLDSCLGDHVLMACRPVGSTTLTLAAHGPREAVFKEVNYKDQERSTVNGVDFYWSPYYEGAIGFGPPEAAYCYGEGASPEDNMCWKVGGNLPLAFVGGWQCGELITSNTKQKAWERVVFQAWE
jgi:cysteine-rich repeat protein